MRTYKITVNGQVYNVDVEEIGASAPVAAPAAAPAPAGPPSGICVQDPRPVGAA